MMFALLVMAGTAQGQPYDPTSYTNSLWHFENGSGTTAIDTMNVANLSFAAAERPNWTTSSIFGTYALDFSSATTDYLIDSTVKVWPTPPTEGTIDLWFNLSKEMNASSAQVALLSRYYGTNQYTILYKYGAAGVDPGKICLLIKNPGDHNVCSTTAVWNPGQIYHITATFGPAGMFLFVNGTLEGYDSNTIGNSVGVGNACGFNIGSSYVAVPTCTRYYPFDGIMDEVRVLSRQIYNKSFEFTNTTASPVSPNSYPLSAAQFNITWLNSTFGTTVALIEHNFTGTMANYTMNNLSTEYYYNYNDFYAGNYSYRFYANTSSELFGFNITNSSERFFYSVYKNSSGLTMTASPGWTTSQSEVTVSCTKGSITPNITLYRDGIAVANPYTATLGIGSYSFNCSLSDMHNYSPSTLVSTLTVQIPAASCLNSSVYAFEKSFSNLVGNNFTINFTPHVKNYLVKSNLSDVSSSRNAWINTTGGYYYTVNTTGLSEITVYFGNYISNRTYGYGRINNVTNLTYYNQQYPYYTVTFIDEITNLQGIPPDANTTLTVYCSLGSTVFSINDTRILFPVADTKADLMKSTVTYPSDYYVRTLVIDNPVESRAMYLVDAYKFSVLQIPVTMTDYTHFNSKIAFNKYSLGTQVAITEGYFGTDRKFTAYLVKDDPYYIRLTKGGTITEMGTYNPSSATALQLSMNTISFTLDLDAVTDYITMGAVNTSLSSIKVIYRDTSTKTNSVRIRVYQDTNQTPFFDNTYATSEINVTVTPVNMTTHYYSVSFEVDHQTFGNSPLEYVYFIGKSYKRYGFGDAPIWIYGTVGFIVMLMISLSITPKDRFAGIIVMFVGLAVMFATTWLDQSIFGAGFTMIMVVFGSVAIIYELKRGGME